MGDAVTTDPEMARRPAVEGWFTTGAAPALPNQELGNAAGVSGGRGT